MNPSKSGSSLLVPDSIKAYHQSLVNGDSKVADTVAFYLEKIHSQRHLNAFTEVYRAEAIKTASALDLELSQTGTLRPLHGVVIALKDVISYKGYAATAASNILQGYKAIYNATVVNRLLQAGAVIIGTCNCDEFAMGSTNENSSYGPVLNAADNSRVPGGSSGGSAVAVQAGMCMASLGSDTGGSVRQPADFCGVVGLKPTYGRISRYGLLAYASSFDQIGIFGNNVADIALIHDTIAGQDEMDGTSSSLPVPDISLALRSEKDKKYKFAFLLPTLQLPGLDEEIRQSIYGLFDKLKKDGHTVEGIDFSYLDHIVPTYYVLTTAEASSNLGRYDGVRFGKRTNDVKIQLTDFYKNNRTEGFGKEVKRRIMLGSFVLSAGFYDAYFTKAQQVRKLIFDQTDAIFKDFDAILMPVSPTTAFKLGEKTTDPVAMYLADIYTVFANLAALPGMAVPLFKHTNGMPFGVQVLTNRFEELYLHRISDMLLAQK